MQTKTFSYSIIPSSSQQTIWGWCQEILEDPDFLILDTETTDLNGQPVEISIIDHKGNTLLNTLIKPTIPIQPAAQAIHHITESELSAAPTMADIWAEFCTITKDKYIITYNASFDAMIINNAAKAYNCEYPFQFYYQCAMDKYAKHWGEYNTKFRNHKWQALSLACEQQGVLLPEDITLHRALGDCRTTLLLIQKIAELGPKTATAKGMYRGR